VKENTPGDPALLRLSCDYEDAPLDWSVEAMGLDLSLSGLAVGDSVSLYYWAIGADIMTIARSAAIVRRPGERDPVLVVHSAPSIVLPLERLDPLWLSIEPDTECDAMPGSCGDGVSRRAAVTVQHEQWGTTTVFDHTTGALGPFAIQVGDAISDDGACEGESLDWFTLAIVLAE
jgi:hypothetical protein